MYEKFTDRARKTMQLANQAAQKLNHDYIGPEHILLGLLKIESGCIKSLLGQLDVRSSSVNELVYRSLTPGPTMVTMGKLPQTPRAKKVIELAIEEARRVQVNYVGTEHILLGLLAESDGRDEGISLAAYALREHGVTLENARHALAPTIGSREENTYGPCPLCGSPQVEIPCPDGHRGCEMLHVGCPACSTRQAATPLKSVDDHNRERADARREAEEKRRKTGVACPKCGGELEWDDETTTLLSNHLVTTSPATCKPCGLTVQLEK